MQMNILSIVLFTLFALDVYAAEPLADSPSPMHFKMLAADEMTTLKLPPQTIQQILGWKAEDFFTDEKVVALCKAIERNDFLEMDRLVKAGADVNAKGKGNMTPLLWSFYDDQLKRFKWLLERGADPNVCTTETLGPPGMMSKGRSVTALVSVCTFHGYFEAVFNHGGDINHIDNHEGGVSASVLDMVIKYGPRDRAAERVQFLIDQGADLNRVDKSNLSPVMHACFMNRFDIALKLLEAGADYKYAHKKSTGEERLIHKLAILNLPNAKWPDQVNADYEKVVAWLEKHSESLATAKNEVKMIKTRLKEKERQAQLERIQKADLERKAKNNRGVGN